MKVSCTQIWPLFVLRKPLKRSKFIEMSLLPEKFLKSSIKKFRNEDCRELISIIPGKNISIIGGFKERIMAKNIFPTTENPVAYKPPEGAFCLCLLSDPTLREGSDGLRSNRTLPKLNRQQ